ncbi:MAG: DUF5615 family PIN-like protein [Flavobacterium sp.]
MQFLCDVHISFKICNAIKNHGHTCIHVNTILDKWHTTDNDIAKYADEFNYILITKDADFRDSFYLKSTPRKIIKVNLGNIPTQNLLNLIIENLKFIEELNQKHAYFIVEVDKENILFNTLD